MCAGQLRMQALLIVKTVVRDHTGRTVMVDIEFCCGCLTARRNSVGYGERYLHLLGPCFAT